MPIQNQNDEVEALCELKTAQRAKHTSTKDRKQKRVAMS